MQWEFKIYYWQYGNRNLPYQNLYDWGKTVFGYTLSFKYESLKNQ